MKELELFLPLKEFFVDLGYNVDGEVKNCDLVGEKDGNLVVVELKKNFQLKLVYQAIERQSITEYVYVALPRPSKGYNTKSWKDMVKLLKRLELGLITVALDSPLKVVEIILEPSESVAWKNRKKRERVSKELSSRRLKVTCGGIGGAGCKEKIVTAYRERCIETLCLLYALKEPISLKDLRGMGIGKEYTSGLSGNVYGWFIRVSKGVYTYSEFGESIVKGYDLEGLEDLNNLNTKEIQENGNERKVFSHYLDVYKKRFVKNEIC